MNSPPNLLPPVLGMRLTSTPDNCCSALPPLTCTAISCVCASLSYTQEHCPPENIASEIIPSMSVRESTFSEPWTVRLPPCHIDVEPPTSNCPVSTAGTVPAIVTKLRPVGSVASASLVTTSRRWLDCTSTMGLTPLTVTLCSTRPTVISLLTGAT